MKTTDDKSTFRELAKLKFELLRKKNEILECFIPIIIKFLTNLNGTSRYSDMNLKFQKGIDCVVN